MDFENYINHRNGTEESNGLLETYFQNIHSFSKYRSGYLFLPSLIKIPIKKNLIKFKDILHSGSSIVIQSRENISVHNLLLKPQLLTLMTNY